MRDVDSLPSNLPAFFWHFLRQQKWTFALLFASPVIHIMESNVQPYALKCLIDALAHFTGDRAFVLPAVAPAIMLYFGAWIGAVIVWRVQESIGVRAWPKLLQNIRMAAFSYVQGHSHQYFSDHFAGSIANKIADLPRSTERIMDFIRFRIITTASVVIAAIIMTGLINAIFAIILGVWVVVQLLLAVAVTRKVDRLAITESEARTTLNGYIVDVLTNITSMRLFARRRYEYDYIGASQAVERACSERTRWEMWKVRMLMDVPVILMSMALLAGVIRGWQQGWVSVGDIVFIMATGFNVIWLVWQLSTELPNLFSDVGTCKQALTIIHTPHTVTDEKDAKPMQVTRGEILFENVHFHYIAGQDIFRDKTLSIPAGQKVGLVGFSGSGKTTFVHLILRFFDVESGRILIDGQDIRQVTQDSLRAQIAMIPQDTSLFHRSLMENIRYGRQEASDEEVLEASRRAHCDEFISQIQNGYHALVGERGIKLSGGQRQRIAIARAILKNAPILILDEATSALDSVTEKHIKESLAELMRKRTTIVIAHRLSTLADMDRILVFKDGRIAEDGTHAELLANGEHYAKLWNMQAGGFLPEDEEE